MNKSDIEFRQVREEDIESLHSCMDSIAKERIYGERLEAYPLDTMRQFMLERIESEDPYLVAAIDNEIVGWCNVFPLPQPVYQHRGTLGMGVVKKYRNQGIGSSLLTAALNAARNYGLERVELEVFSANTVAVKLYKKHGFEVEGVKQRAKKLDEEYDDIVSMSLFL